MSTVADLLSVMQLLNNELKTGASQKDEDRSVLALSMAQHYFETIAGSLPKILQSTIDISTTADQETTTWSTTLLRLDALQLLDANGRPIRSLESIGEIGGHAPSLPWPLEVQFSTGGPFAFYGNMRNFYWMGVPSEVRSLRVYGFVEQSEFASRASTFAYPDRFKLPFAVLAVKILRLGLDDPGETELDRLSTQLFTPLLRQLMMFDRTGPKGRVYTQPHTT